MKATRKVTWTLKDGRQAECTIEVTREMREEIAYADGWNVPLGKKPFEFLEIELSVAGKCLVVTHTKPSKLDKKFYRNYDELIAKGAYARLGDAYINQESYELITNAIAEATAEAEKDEEYAAHVNKEAAVEAEKKAVEEAETAAKFTEAKKTGKPVVITQWMEDCNDPHEECSTDIITVYAMPDGTRKTSRIHTW